MKSILFYSIKVVNFLKFYLFQVVKIFWVYFKDNRIFYSESLKGSRLIGFVRCFLLRFSRLNCWKRPITTVRM